MDTKQLEYLKQAEVGEVVVRGLASLYTARPSAPVAYLAQWLKSYSAKQKLMHGHLAAHNSKLSHLDTYNRTEEVKRTLAQEQIREEQKHESRLTAFKTMLHHHDYHEELLEAVFPEFLEKELGSTGVYVGELNYPRQAVSDADEGEHAHLNLKAAKIVNYIGSSESHRELMVGKTLALDQGVTAAAFSLEGAKYVYLPNVVHNPAVHYFRLPKLGAFIAMPLVYNSYLNEKVFDVLKAAKKTHIAALHHFQEEKDKDLEELEKEKGEIAKKAGEGEEEAQEQLKEVEGRIKERQEEEFEATEVEAPSDKREFVVCADTLGLDREMAEEERNKLVALVEHFCSCWEAREKHLIDEDINFHIEYEKALILDPASEREALERRAEVSAEKAAEWEAIEDESVREYKANEWRVLKLKAELQTNNHYKQAFVKLSHFRVVKYTDFIAALLYTLRFSKNEVNCAGKATLNWKKARTTYITTHTYDQLIEFVVEGPKTLEYAPYMKTPALLEKFEKLDEAEIFTYNIGLGAILKFLKSALALRESNVELRKVQKEKSRKAREVLIEEHERVGEEKKQTLEKHKATLSLEEVESFKEEEWSAKYDEENPLQEIGPEIVDDIDNDI